MNVMSAIIVQVKKFVCMFEYNIYLVKFGKVYSDPVTYVTI